ncbi:unnamed protein product [Caenorhabditis angaria]|uniref:Mitochondrial inner membrane protein Mpv17 n=1 Tax=Caenorhabditis angaria TaxID=860376 RepID=A0A9P1I9X6_9PELO|nr:unnamed protein product [Caenorhabditis angaria]
MSHIIRSFNTILHRRPLLTQMVISGTVSGAGDMFAQYITGQKEWDKLRTARFVTLAAVFIAPPLNIWFRLLEKIQHKNRHILVAKRMLPDQLVFSPVFNAFILTNLRVLEGFSIDESISKMKNDWYDVYTNSLALWPAVQLCNFYFVPLHYRVIVIQVVAFFWNSYLSFKTQKH